MIIYNSMILYVSIRETSVSGQLTENYICMLRMLKLALGEGYDTTVAVTGSSC